MNTICFVVATKDRPDDLRRMLDSLSTQTRLPDLVIVVDSSAAPVSDVTDEFNGRIQVRYIHHQQPSASGQRNVGIEAVPRDIELIAFLDDDATLEPDALERMLNYWVDAPADMGGTAFNMINHPKRQMARVKRWPLVRALGIYTGEPGQVTMSGWQTTTGFVSRHTEVDWLSTGAAVWRAKILRETKFDEFFTAYSYLEDLDFSYTVRRNWRLAVVADARYHHYPSPVRHTQQYDFGRTEVRNRLYFVAKHQLSYPKCWLGLMLRTGLTICNAVSRLDKGPLSRAWGNCAAMAAELTRAPGTSIHSVSHTEKRFVASTGNSE